VYGIGETGGEIGEKGCRVLIIPAIDLKNGRCVRLWQGERDKETVYSQEPLSVARTWAEKGARRLHIVDLDGAFQGRPIHLKIVERISAELNIPVEFGGGLRNLSTIRQVFEKKIDYAIVGSQALSLKFVGKACQEFGDRIIISIDARDGKVAIEGWERQTSIQARDLAKDLAKAGVSTIIFTDITRDGTMRGINIEAVKDFAGSCDVEVIISGGISSLDDLKKITRLNNPRIRGIIIGKALYTGAIKLEEAIKIVES